MKTTVDLKKKDTYKWALDFFDELRKKRKVALRKGELAESSASYLLDDRALKKLCKGELSMGDIKEKYTLIFMLSKEANIPIIEPPKFVPIMTATA